MLSSSLLSQAHTLSAFRSFSSCLPPPPPLSVCLSVSLSVCLSLSLSLSIYLSICLSQFPSLCEMQEMEMRRWKSTITDATAMTTTQRPRAIVCLMYSRTYARSHACIAPTRFKYRRRQCWRHTRVVVAAYVTACDDRAHTNCAAYPSWVTLSLVLCIRDIVGIRTSSRRRICVCAVRQTFRIRYPHCVVHIDRISEKSAANLLTICLKAYLD